MALKRVKTLARTMAHSERLVPPGARLTRPLSTRSATSASVNPWGIGVVSTAACCTWSSCAAEYRRNREPGRGVGRACD